MSCILDGGWVVRVFGRVGSGRFGFKFDCFVSRGKSG